jgi:hypothetical protein
MTHKKFILKMRTSPIAVQSKKDDSSTAIVKNPVSNRLKDRFPEAFKQIHPTLNSHIDIDKLTYGESREVYWQCANHTTCNEHVWKRKVCRQTDKSQCPFCVHQNGWVCPCDSFGHKFPVLLEEFNLAKNFNSQYNQTIDPLRTSCGSDKVCHWKCSNPTTECDHHIWSSPIGGRCRKKYLTNTLGFVGCPFCSKHKCCPCTSIATLYPALVREFESAKLTDKGKSNHDINLSQVSVSSEKMCWWKCADHQTCDEHIWQAMVINRTKNGSGCPFCNVGSSKRVCQCDSVAKLYPKLMEEFICGETSNVDLNKISHGSVTICRWQCSVCSHKWPASIANRARKGTGCPKCSSSHLELHTESILVAMQINVECQKSFPDCIDKGELKFDFFLPSLNILIELDGEQHFFIVYFSGNDKPPSNIESQHRRDRIKNIYAKDNNIHLLRIAYTELKNIKIHITDFINDVKLSTTRQEKFVGDPYLTQNYKEKVLY